MKVYLGTDHAGFELKEKIKSWLVENEYNVEDCGAHSYNPEDDYPDFMHPVAMHVSDHPDQDVGIIFGGSGQGEAITANRHHGVRCAVFYGGRLPVAEIEQGGDGSADPLDFIRLSRKHNAANVLSIGARFVTFEEARDAVQAWLTQDFSHAPRHERRIAEIEDTGQ